MGVTTLKRKFLRFIISMVLILSVVIVPMSAMAAPRIVSILKVTVEYGRLREGPSSDYDVITTLAKGERVFYLNQNSGAFCLVRTSRGQVGYIYRGFLQTYGACRLDQIYYANGSVRVYKTPGGKALGTLSRNDHVLVYKTQGGWALIKNLVGNTG